ncbi:arginase family protein [Thermophagus sp. OGC60D27]|uniref:arginase family protein n=1 Tax=Thermophagus sp. OGC60D27 TaxID=3458415 RepID=UPI004037F2DC
MEIIHYLEPLKSNWICYPGIAKEETLGHQMVFFDGQDAWFDNNEFDIAIIGVPEVRNSTRHLSGDVSKLVKQWLYGMRKVSSDLRIADLGSVKGNGLQDRYFALTEVIKFLNQKGVSVLIIGGSQDLTLPASQFLKNKEEGGNIVIVDSVLDVDPNELDFSSTAYIHKLIEELNNKINDLSVLGIQIYYCSGKQEEYLVNRCFPVVRLKELRGEKIERFEVFLRDATMLSFDFGALKGQASLPHGMKMPNGFTEAEGCRIFWYAGASDNLKVTGLFDIGCEEDDQSSIPAAAQMLWHYLEGSGVREGDYPLRSVDEYELKAVFVEPFEETLKFYHNPKNDRWWILVPSFPENKIVACHADDYQQALKNELPEIWWRYFSRTTGSQNNVN